MSRQIRPLGLSKNVEVPLVIGNKKKFGFSDSVLLLDRVLIHALYIPTLCVRTPEFQYIPVFGQMQGGYITLCGYENQQYNVNMPLHLFTDQQDRLFNNIEQMNWSHVLFFNPKLISIRNSFVEFPNISAWLNNPAGGNTFSLPMTIFYELYDEQKHQLNSWGELINDTEK